MTKFIYWIQLCVVIVTPIIGFGVTKDAICCYHDNTKCMEELPTCIDKSLIILDDIKWNVKPNCTPTVQDEDTCSQCCFYSNEDLNVTLSNSDSVEIYSRCHRQSSCDPCTNLPPPSGFENGYLRVRYACEQETSSGADDTAKIPVYVIYATIFPVIGLSVILVLICTYRWYVNKRRGAVRPKTSKTNGNERMANDTHTSDKETKSIDEMFTASQISLQHIIKSKAAVGSSSKLQDCHSTDVPSGGKKLNIAVDNTSNGKECSEPDESNVINETDDNNRPFPNSGNTSYPDSDQGTDGPQIMYTYGVTQSNTKTHKSSSLPGHRTVRNDRTKMTNATSRRNARQSRKQQKQLIRNMKLMKSRMHNERKLRDSVSSSDEYSPISTSCTSSFDTNGEESNQGQSLDCSTNDLIAIEQNCLKTETNYKTCSINRSQKKNNELKINMNEGFDIAQYGHGDQNAVKESISSELLNKPLDTRFVDSLEQQTNDINEITGNESVLLHSNTHVTEENYSSTNVTSRSTKSETNTKSLNQQTHHSYNLPNVSKEGPIATSSFRNENKKETKDVETVEDYEKANSGFKLGTENSLPAWCIPKPPDTVPDMQNTNEQSEGAHNKTPVSHECDKRRNEVIYKRRKRKFESMREAKRETIFGILQKLEAVPKRSILKKSKSMIVTKHECTTNHHEERNRKTLTFADDINLTDLDKIHKLTEPCEQYTSDTSDYKHSNRVKNTHANKKSSDMLPRSLENKKEHCNAILNEENNKTVVCEPLLTKSKNVFEAPHHIDANFRGVISSNLKQNSLNAEMNDKVHDVDSNIDKLNGIDEMEESSQDSSYSQQQMNVREKFLRGRKNETDVSDEDTLSLPDASMKEWPNNGNHLDRDLPRFRNNIDTTGSNNDIDVVDDVIGNEVSKRHLNGFGHSTIRNDHTDDKVKQGLLTESHVVEKDTYHTDFESEEDVHTSDSSEYETMDDRYIAMDTGNHSFEEEKFPNSKYYTHSMTNIDTHEDRNSGEISPKPEPFNKHIHPNLPSPSFGRFPGYPVKHPELSSSTLVHDQANISQIHSGVNIGRFIDQLPKRPKSALGGRPKSAKRVEHHWVHDAPKLQSSKTCTDLQSSRNLGGQSHDPQIIPKQAGEPRDSVFKKSTKGGIERNLALGTGLITQQEQRTIQQDESKLKHLNLKQTFDPYTPNPSNTPRYLANKDKYGGSQSKMNKETTGYLQNFITEFNSRVNHSSKNPRSPLSPFDMQGRSVESLSPIRRSKTPMPSTLSREDQDDKVSLARNLSLRSERISLQPSFSRNKATKFSEKIDTQLDLREQEIIISKDKEAKKLLNRRLKEKNKVYENHDFKEPARERPKSAMSGRFRSRSGNRSAVGRNKSMSNGSVERETSSNDIRRDSRMPKSANSDFYLSEATSGTQGSVAGWSRWNHRLDNPMDRRSQPTFKTDVQLEEYDSELENFFANPDAEVLQISNGSSRDRQALSRSKSCKV